MTEKPSAPPAPPYEEPAEIHELAPAYNPTPTYSQPSPIQPPEQPNRTFYAGSQHPSGYSTATPLHALQRGPAPVDCPVCGHREMTRVVGESGNTTHAWAAVLCFCCCLGCIPYLMSSLKDEKHYCGHCGALLATWHNSGRTDVNQVGRA
ncbi:hypothetical protein BO71DRAFT_89013 [Aspergillus ellipticus CBS 707.79]|uniref:LITAF domain-containing protein n=1 Tax=Aspergillus ellipticus CBS 707.79 TaxID=1448320 RepID=A0A319DKF8_9EURO|nr:hypothetical protein BO71DRAFT_89013 [Aspergillus ellipticus CBS 707.79]